AGGYRTALAVPLMREGAAIGVLAIARSTPRPFTPQQIELAETFADQAVIAIENVRLFDEIQDKSRQCVTPGQAFPLRTRRSCSRRFSRLTVRSPGRRAAPAWGLPYRSASLRCTAAEYGLSRNLAKAPPLRSRCRSSSSGRWRPHEQAHSGCRG